MLGQTGEVTLDHDDLGYPVPLARAPRRVVSLVPSLTEAIVRSAAGILVGATEWCVHPAALDVPRVRGTKNPHIARIRELAPDLVIANEEENRRRDVEALRAAGVPVWVTVVSSVDSALQSLERLLAVLEAPDREWLGQARHAWAAHPPGRPTRHTAVVAIWRRPWMWLGRDTYAGDVLARLGVANALGDGGTDGERYPRVDPADLPAHDLVVLPDEPYAFNADDGPEQFPGERIMLVDGQALTWYGPRMIDTPAVVSRALTAASPGGSANRE